jgi:ribonuclease HI
VITYYTDGSCRPTNPGPGGFAVIRDGKVWVLGGEGENSTNIRMEGEAMLAALKDAAGQTCTIYSDSEFWINVLTKWAPGWKSRGWRKSAGEIKNLDLVKTLYAEYVASDARLVWVKGHADDEGNILADKFAGIAAGRDEDALNEAVAEVFKNRELHCERPAL